MLLLSEVLPLRTTKALGDFAEDTPLPHVYGDLSDSPFPLIRLSEMRYFVADHPMSEVSRVFIDRQEVFAWEAKLESDDDGHTWQIVQFSSAVAQSAVVWATGKGKLDPDTGELIENPGDVAESVGLIGGRSDDFSDIRAEAGSITVAGVVSERKAIRLHYDDIFESCGTIWTPQMARRYPADVGDDPVLDLLASEVREIAVKATLLDTADVLRLAYGWSEGRQKCQRYIEFTASPQRYGGLAVEREFRWIHKAQDAEALGVPALKRLSGERYEVDFNTARKSVRPGMWVRPVAHPEWPLTTVEDVTGAEERIDADDTLRVTADGETRVTDGTQTTSEVVDPIIMVLKVEVEPDQAFVRVTGETIIGESTITVTAHSIALSDEVESGVEVEFRDGVATFTITDEDGKPLPGAVVSLDGAAPKTTNAQGKVSFNTEAGTHELAIEAPGFVGITVTITI